MTVYGPVCHQKYIIWTSNFFWWRTGPCTAICPSVPWTICYLLTLKKKTISWTQRFWIFFNKKLILDYYFCLKSGPVFLFQIFIIAPSPSQGIYNCIINNKLINSDFLFKINLIYKTTDICSIFNADLSNSNWWQFMATIYRKRGTR